MPEIVNPDTHHEKSDVNVRALLWAVVIFIVFGAVTHFLLYAQFHYCWINLTTLLAIGGIWMFEFIRQLKGQTIIPVHETWVEEAIREGAVKIHA